MVTSSWKSLSREYLAWVIGRTGMGVSYCTILINMETSRPIELLLSRDCQALKNWLLKYNDVKIVMAQHEAKRISQRTRAGLQAAKARGVRLGSPQNLTEEARAKAHASISRKAREDQSVSHAWHYIKPLREKGLLGQRLQRL